MLTMMIEYGFDIDEYDGAISGEEDEEDQEEDL